MTVVNFANVFVRYVLKSNLHWALEFTVISFAWIIFLGAAWGIKSSAPCVNRYRLIGLGCELQRG